VLPTTDLHDAYERDGYVDLTDAQLFDRTAAAVAVPRLAAANSFVLHAPLELMARRLLLPFVPPARRRSARQRMVDVVTTYEQAGPPVPPPARDTRPVEQSRSPLLAAMAAGDLDAVDAAAVHLLAHAGVDEVLALAGPTVELLAAAGHAPIGFFLAGGTVPARRSSLALLRPLLRELARQPDLRVGWVDDIGRPADAVAPLADALARTPRLGLPGTAFIFPLVHQVDAGVARDRLAGRIPADLTAAAAVILRAAAHSMLQDDPEFAPYGWTHCLTLPHAILELAPSLPDARRATAVAATYVLAFRAGEGGHDIDLGWVPEPTITDPREALDAEPAIAAGAWYHATDDLVAACLPELVGRAAVHHDAHLVKYTLACLAAAERDPAARRLYLAAAASLSAWWVQHPSTGFDA